MGARRMEGAVVSETCSSCNGKGWYYRDDPSDGTHYDCYCIGPSDSAKAKWLSRSMKCLASNLTIGAALCKADDLGRDFQHAMTVADEQDFRSERERQRAAVKRDYFHPGCGRGAP